MQTKARSLYDEVMTLRMAIEEAIIKGQKSVGGLSDVGGIDLVPNEGLGSTWVNGDSGVVGWVDDL